MPGRSQLEALVVRAAKAPQEEDTRQAGSGVFIGLIGSDLGRVIAPVTSSDEITSAIKHR